MMQDNELLRAYWRHGSETAFEELVRRYVGFVFSTARRQVSDAALAEDISQQVFCLLARKAHSLSRLSTLAGWLYRATCFCAAKARRREMRRRKREQEAMTMNPVQTEVDDVWERLAPILDEALATLGDKERLLILLRFFQSKPMREVGDALGISEAAAKMRVARSIERLRQFFARRGVACSIAGLTALLAERSIEAAPPALARNLSRVALSATASAAGLSFLQTLPVLAKLNSSQLILAGATALLCSFVGWQVFHAARQLPSNSLVAEQPGQQSAVGPARPFQTVPHPSAAPEHDDLADLINNLRLALHSTDNSEVPSTAVIAAVYRFGSRLDAAFSVLKEEAGAHDKARFSTDPDELAPRRAVSAMGFVGKSVPEAVIWLWDLYEKEPDTASDSMAFQALSALEQIGFQPQDIGRLAREVLTRNDPLRLELLEQGSAINEREAKDAAGNAFVKAQVAEWIAKIIQQDPAGSMALLPDVRGLLASPDADARFWAACALLQSEGAQNSSIASEISNGLKNGSQSRIAWASKFLQGLGEAAQPIVPALLEAANASVGNTREWAFLSAGKLQGDLRTQVPEVELALQKDEADEALLDKLNSNHYTAKDLIIMLQDSGSAEVAANLLAEKFPLAKDTLPALCAAVSRPENGESVGTILTSIRKLDPTAALAPEDVTSIAESLLSPQSSPDDDKAFRELLDKNQRLDMSWSTRSGFQTFAKNLAARNPSAYKAFVTAVLEKEPSWESQLPAMP